MSRKKKEEIIQEEGRMRIQEEERIIIAKVDASKREVKHQVVFKKRKSKKKEWLPHIQEDERKRNKRVNNRFLSRGVIGVLEVESLFVYRANCVVDAHRTNCVVHAGLSTPKEECKKWSKETVED